VFKRVISWVAEYADAVLALLLALIFGLLGLVGDDSPTALSGAILTTLAVIAIAILRDRANKVSLDREVRNSTAHIRDVLEQLPSRLGQVERLAESVAELRGLVEGTSTVRTLRGREVEVAHETGRSTTDHWYFKGGTGTYSRAVTLPSCTEIARTERRVIQIRIEIIDPTDDAVCQRYENFRRSVSALPDGTGQQWSAGRARVESFATVIAACWYQQRVRFLEVRLALTSVTSAFRYDMFSAHLIITQDDPSFPALLVPRGRPLYDEYNLELANSFEQARRIPLERLVSSPLSETPTIAEVQRTLELLELKPERALDEAELASIIEKAVNARNPYASEGGGGS
jgi:hypothetical protein